MATLFRRGKTYHFDFRFRGQRHQGSTYCTNKEKAESFVAAYRTNLAHGLVGLTAKEPLPALSTFLNGAFWSNIAQHITKPGTLKRYRLAIARLVEFEPFKLTAIDAITQTSVDEYATYRRSMTVGPACINSELRCLRKALRYAARCKLIHYAPFSTLPGERNREFVLTGEMELKYLELAEYPLRQVSILMLDLGLRPEECVALRKSDIGKDPQEVAIRAGKTANARRVLPQTARVKVVLDLCSALFPSSEFVFPGRFGGHATVGWITNLHRTLRMKHGLPPEFALYACRHTYGTRLAESGATPFEICYLMGHSSIKVSERYIHLGPKSVTLAAKRLEAYSRILRGEVHEEQTSNSETSSKT